MGSGKSTAMEQVRDLSNRKVVNLKFAAPLYEMQELLYKTIEPVYKRPKNFVKDRKLLQFLGTEWARNTISPTIWIDLWKYEFNYIQENAPEIIVMVDDVRFDNEAEAIKSFGGILLQIKSDKTETRIDTKSGITGHASEGGIDLKHVDYIVENNGTIDDLRSALLAINSREAIW